MLNTKSSLAIDFGAGSLKLAEFEGTEDSGLRLKQYSITSLGPEGAQENAREGVITKTLQQVMTEKGIKTRNVNVCAPGFHVFSKFVKLPPVDAGKVTQIIQYEAQQNVPFPLAEVVWDYQILGSSANGELEVLLVAIKADIVEGLFRITEAQGLHQQIADVSPAALCNAFRYNYGELEDCSMLLDIGAKTSNLLFFEKGKIYSRSINLGANSITQDFANEAKLSFDKAEKIKVEHGFVSLGGAYEDPDNPHQAAISKIARQFMTRLHIQVNQTMQFYRGQQGGSAPVRLFLSGGASIMDYTPQFFAEKLNVPVEYFNPLRKVQIDPSINLEELARVAHSLGEVVGLGLRNLAHCPVELNLMPASTLKWQRFNQKKPYFIATAFSLAAGMWAIGLLFGKLAQAKEQKLNDVIAQVQPLEQNSTRFKQVYGEFQKTQKQQEQLFEYLNDRYYWADVLTELRQILARIETSYRPTDAGIWIEKLTIPGSSAGAGTSLNPPPGMGGPPMPGAPDPTYMQRYNRGGAEGSPPAAPMGATPGTTAGAGSAQAPGLHLKGTSMELTGFTVTFRAVSLTRVSNKPEANKDLAYAVVEEIGKSPFFDKDQTRFASDPGADEPPGTFTFGVTIGFKKPLKL
ncbi:MAG: hypothetical protein C5B50_21755 [Verrucomicrobia bacterium]|nr:MAG: hypothetical protein C5B50_21755 [Verrucomicrobiota bacterium]